MPSEDYPVSDKRFRPPSAYKHGGFSKTVLFPWEDADEFDDLHRSLQEEWEPSGALEEDAVYTILTCIWRKHRIRDKRNLDTLAALQKQDLKELSEKPLPFFDTKQEKTMYALKHMPRSDGRPRYDGAFSQLVGFSSSLYGRLDGQFLELSIGMLGGELSTDRILEDLTLEERLDAMVDRAMRRLAQMKFMKQISGSSERQLQRAATLQIEGPPKSKRQKKKTVVR
jgi:hypothetical protein